jgi:hypothetical protein
MALQIQDLVKVTDQVNANLATIVQAIEKDKVIALVNSEEASADLMKY